METVSISFYKLFMIKLGKKLTTDEKSRPLLQNAFGKASHLKL